MRVVAFTLIGVARTGKTQVIENFLRKRVTLDAYSPTIGIDFYPHTHTSRTQRELKVQFWDSGDYRRYRSIVRSYMMNRHAIFCFFDLRSQESFDYLLSVMDELVSVKARDCRVVLVGNFKDHNAIVDRETIGRFVSKYEAYYYELVANDIPSITRMFTDVIDLCEPRVTQPTYTSSPIPEPAQPCCFL